MLLRYDGYKVKTSDIQPVAPWNVENKMVSKSRKN